MPRKVLFGFVFMLALMAFLPRASIAQSSAADYAVQVSVTVATAPARITLNWPLAADASTIKISRKAPEATSWTQLRALVGSATSYTDTNVTTGVAYEYRVMKYTEAGYFGTGYALAGINLSMVDSRGTVILIVDKTYVADLAAELAQLQRDLLGEGWEVIRRDVARTDSPAAIKSFILSDYVASQQRVKAVFLFGHVPVPYSGAFAPDGHSDHFGAWPADAYYGELTSKWTDTTANTQTAARAANWNVPGDGKFDQTELPSPVELAVGRVDLSNLNSFATRNPPIGEVELHRNYLKRNHEYRHGRLVKPRAGFVCDNFGTFVGEAFAASGWRNFAPLFGPGKTFEIAPFSFVPTISSEPYSWGFGGGAGFYLGAIGLGTSTELANIDIKTTFLMLFGSYFGDWDNTGNFMRTALGSGDCLAVMWTGRPHWWVHHMALGETLGYSTLKTQNNRFGGIYARENPGSYLTHTSLLGDPTLRQHPFRPPTEVAVEASEDGAKVTWGPSQDPDVFGYVIYRAKSVDGPFARITPLNSVANGRSFTDTGGSPRDSYMIRAVKVERTASGSYFNPSIGIITALSDTGERAIPATPSGVRPILVSSNRVSFEWTDNSENEAYFEIYRRVVGSTAGVRSYTVLSNVTSLLNSGLTPAGTYGYKVRAGNQAGVSPWSSELVMTLLPASPGSGAASATFIGKDTLTQGNWEGTHGASGYLMAGIGSVKAPYADIVQDSSPFFAWADPTTNPAGLKRPGSDARVGACWYSGGTLQIFLNFNDNLHHRVALYCTDFDNGNRQQAVEIVDRSTGTVLNSQILTGFQGGAYLVWNVQRNVIIRVLRQNGFNCVVSGVFLD